MIKQYYGIKFPFTDESDDLTFLDMNETKEEGIKSMLMHIILTPKGQRLRKPDFGTNLVKYIFEPNDNNTWEGIKEEVSTQISYYLPQITLTGLNIIKDENEENDIYLQVDYIININEEQIHNKTLIKL